MAKRQQPFEVGELWHTVDIELATGTISPTGGVIAGAVTTVAEAVPMAIDAVDVQAMAAERLAAGGLQGTTVYTARCRYRTDFDSKAVLVERCCSQRRLEILSLAPMGRNEALEMLCVERTA